MKISHLNDGVDHINIYSAGKTQLGKCLSNFTFCNLPTEDGYFCSVEGYWFWLIAGENCSQREILRELYGIEARKKGKELCQSDEWPSPLKLHEFKNKILKSFRIKIDYNPIIKEMFIKSELPFTHYYNFNGKVIIPKKCKWMIQGWENIRKELKCQKEKI